MLKYNESWSIVTTRTRRLSDFFMFIIYSLSPLLSVSSTINDTCDIDVNAHKKIPTWIFPNDIVFPTLAANTASLSASQTEAMVRKSLSLGITNIDFHLGGTERDGVAAVLRNVPRDSIFLVTKMDKPPADMTDPEEAAHLVRSTIDKEWSLLGVENVDILLLKDSPSCDVMQAQWKVLEEILKEGKTRGLGFHNFCQFSIDCVLEVATEPAYLNYILGHVGMGIELADLIQYAEDKGIRTVKYGTLGEPVALEELLTNPTLIEIAKTHHRSVEEVALRYNVQLRHGLFSSSNRPYADYAPSNTPNMASCGDDIHADCGVALKGMREVFEWELTKSEMKKLQELRLESYPQSPTYYASAGCSNSLGVVDHPTESSCKTVNGAWCGSITKTE